MINLKITIAIHTISGELAFATIRDESYPCSQEKGRSGFFDLSKLPEGSGLDLAQYLLSTSLSKDIDISKEVSDGLQ